MFSREDGVVMVTHPSGATVVEHADGTRISTYFKEMPSTLENQEPEIVIGAFRPEHVHSKANCGLCPRTSCGLYVHTQDTYLTL